MAKIIRPNLVNTVRSSEISAMLRWGALFAVLLAGAVGLLLAKQYLPAAVCILILPIALPLAKKQIGVIRAGADGEAETLRLLRKLPADWTVIPDAVIEYRGHRSQTDYILIAPAGVLILEAKNVSGKVTGRAEDRELSQYKPSRGGHPAEQKRMYNCRSRGTGPPFRIFSGLRGFLCRCAQRSILPTPTRRCASTAL